MQTERILKHAFIMAMVAIVVMGTAQAATYTWIQGGVASDWDDPDNWLGGSVIPANEPNAKLVFSSTASGTIGNDDNTAATKVMFGSLEWETGVDMRIGSYTSAGTITVDTDSTNNATATYMGASSHLFQAYYVTWLLNNNLEILGDGAVLNVRAYQANGVTGTGGFIINDGTELTFTRTHGSDDYNYSGGVTIRSGGIVNTTGRSSGNGALGTGRLTIEEGGQLQTVDDLFGANDATFVIDGSTDGTSLLISGAGAAWNASGTWTFDVSGLEPVVGSTWNIISGTATYDAAFSVAGFAESGGVWTGNANGAEYQFDESTGVLQVTAAGGGEPGTLIYVK